MQSASAPDLNDITGCVLAGGQGSRMGGVDKGLQDFLGQPLAARALQRLAPQVGPLLVNANRHPERYAALAQAYMACVVADAGDRAAQAYLGPLAGFLAALQVCQTPWLLTVPCDTPNFPLDLAERMLAAASQHQAELVLAHGWERRDTSDGRPDPHLPAQMRAQPVFCLLRTSLRDSLQDYLASGGRKIDTWTAQHRSAHACWDRPEDDPQAFANANTLAQLQALAEQQLAPR